MAPLLAPRLLWQELLCCGGLGLLMGTLRSFFPRRGAGALLPDLLLVGGLLTVLQSYAAGLSYAGILRWYMAAAAVAGALLGSAALGQWPCRLAAGLLSALLLPLRAAGMLLYKPVRALRQKHRQTAPKSRKNSKNSLPKPPVLLYNSNV